MDTSPMMLSSLVQTRSLELVLAPIASHVSQLASVTEIKGIAPYSNLMPSALRLMESIQDVTSVAHQTSESADDQLQSELPVLCDFTLKAGSEVLEAAGRLCEDADSTFAQSMLVRSAHDVLEGIMKILLVWDASEVRKIIKTTEWVLDRLALVQGAKSMRGLVICYGGFSEALMQLLNLVDKRQKELTNSDRKQRLLASLDLLKKDLPNFTAAMKNYVRSPSSTPAKESKDSLADTMSSSLKDLIQAVKTFEDEVPAASNNMAANILEVQQKLASHDRYFIGAELDEHIDSIMKNSDAVAHVSRDQYRGRIQRMCREITELRKKLGDQLEAIYENPESEEMRSAFDVTADQLCDKLLELDRWVADAVVDQVTDTFVYTSAPITSLVNAAHTMTSPVTSTSPISSQASSGTVGSHEKDTLSRHVELFRRHSRRLSEVAAYAAQSSTDVKRVQAIKVLASDVDKLTPKVVSAAVVVNKNPKNREAKNQLEMLKQEWGVKVQQLTGAIDDIIDPEDFVAISEENIRQDMEKCRTAIHGGNWSELNGIVQGIAAKARRVMDVGKAAVENASDHTYKATLSSAVHRLEKAIPRMLALNNELISNPSSHSTHDQFVATLKELLESIQDIQDVLSSGIDIPKQEESSFEGSSTSASRLTAQERMMRKKLRSLNTRSRYIGSLGAAVKGDTSRTRTTFDETDSQLETSVAFGHSHFPQESFSEGFSQSFNSGDAQTQTPRHCLKDQSSQVEDHFLSTLATHGSPNHHSQSLESSTASWTTPTSPSKVPVEPSTPPPPLPTSSPPSGPSPTPRLQPTVPDDHSVKSYVSPLQKLVAAAKDGDSQHVSSQATALSARAIRLTGIAESAATALQEDSELVKLLKVRSEEVKRLTPRIIRKAQQVATSNPQQRNKMSELDDATHQWAGQVRQLIDATQQANLPWSKTAEKLVDAAKTGVGVQAQMEHVSTQTRQMVDIATMTIQAAETEEGIGCTDVSQLTVDPDLQKQITHVKVTINEITKLTPQMLSAAKMAENMPEGSAAVENLNLLSHEWATKAKVLLKGVDDITLGMSSAADSLLISAKSGDPGLLSEQTKSISRLASSLYTIAEEAVQNCSDEEKVEVVCVAADNIRKLSTQLIDCANIVARETKEHKGECSPVTQENSELLRRNWSSQVHFLTAHIDDLTAEVSSPLDHLVDIALQASKTTGPAKEHLLQQFKTKSAYITNQLGEVDRLFLEATDPLHHREESVDNASAAIVFLKKLTPHAVGAARSLADNPGSAMLEHFNHLRRQWASKAEFLLANLRSVRSIDVEPVLVALNELFHPSHSSSFETPLHKSLSTEVIGEDKQNYVQYDVSEPSTPQRRQKRREPTAADLGLKPVPRNAKRPVSMTVPLPSWASGQLSSDHGNVSSQSIAAAAQSLRDVADVFLEDNNPIVSVAKKMSEQMSQMAEYTRGRGELQSKTEMINTAKAIAANGQTIVRFANLLSKQCTDERIKGNLQYCSEMIPTLSTQLRIIASVKASTPDDTSADVMLVKNAQNLIKAVVQTVQAAEAACMKGLLQVEEGSDTAELAMSWKRKLYHQRTMEAINAPRGARGLRKLNRNRISTPSVVDIIKPSAAVMCSPTKHT